MSGAVRMRLWALAVTLLAALVVACDVPTVEREPEGRYVSSSSLVSGDCIWRKQHEHPVWGSVKVVECSGGQWDFRVLNRIRVDGGGPFPGDEHLESEAQKGCQTGWTMFLVPSSGLWNSGNHWIICFAERQQPDA